MDMYISVNVVLGILALYLYLRFRTSSRRKGMEIPSPSGWPIVGNAFELNKGTVYNTFFDFAETYGDIFKLTVFGKSLVVLNKAELIRTAFNSDPYKKYMNDRVKTFLGEYVFFKSIGIIAMPKAIDSVHGELRKSYTRALNVYGEGRDYFEGKIALELHKFHDRLETLEGNPFDMIDMFKRSLTNVISIILGGHDIDDDDENVNIFWEFDRNAAYFLRPDVNVILRTFPFLRFVPGSMYKQHYDKVQKASQIVIRRYVTEKKITYTHGTIRGIVDFMFKDQMETRKEGRESLFNDERIYALTMETIGAGLITTLSTLSSIFLCLVNYPEYQVKIQKELDRVIGRNRQPTLADKQACVFTEAVCMEVQRYITAIPLGGIHYCEPNMDFEGYNIPEHSTVLPNLWYIHHDQNVWGDPWRFRPERFLDDNGDLLPNDHVLRKNLMPFGTGRRMCLGEGMAKSRIFLYVTYLLQRWKFEMPQENFVRCDPRDGDNFEEDLTIRPRSYICKAVPRN